MDEFRKRLHKEWLIPFCERHGYSDAGFVVQSIDKLDPIDAKDFLAAVDDGLVLHENGIFRAPCSKATEQIFWQWDTKQFPVKISLWREPIITMAGLARLHRSFGWPRSQLGMQSKSWAFDLMAYSPDQSEELIACEVKKSCSEIEKLVFLMQKHRFSSEEAISSLSGSERNALKKVIGLRLSKPPLFWALGPNSQSMVFKMEYDASSGVHFELADEQALLYAIA
jgi:hypothetical protein